MSLLQAGFGSSGDDYTIDDSLRFRSSATAYLDRTPATAGNRKTWTWSGWVKRSKLDAEQVLFAAGTAASNTAFGQIMFGSDNTFRVNAYSISWRTTTQLFRDVSAWYHIVVVFDTTQATAADRVNVYLNGTQVTSFSVNNAPTLNTDYSINQNIQHTIGRNDLSGGLRYFDGYQTEVNFVDGQALDPTDFGEFDANGTWKPLAYTGTYGTNGFYLPFRNRTEGTVSADYLVIAGGGGGNNAGGGGAGGYLTGSSLTLNTTTGYAVTVGAGGTSGVVGSDSVFLTITSDGGGNAGVYTAAGGNGGSGGGGTAGVGGTATAGQGNNGGTGFAAAWAGAGGGGGAGAVGANGSVTGASPSRVDGAGGAGLSSSITGSAVTRAGGGGGGSSTYGTAGAGGSGGGGAGTTGAGTTGGAGTANTGGGGGGGRPGGTGGSGVVIISYSGVQKFSGGTITASGSNTIHTFTTSGFLTTVFNDSSGNDNNWTGNNFNVSDSTATTYDLMKDTPSLVDENAGNFAVINPLVGPSADTFSEGNLKIATSLSYAAFSHTRATIGVSSGKWYWEVEWDAKSATSAESCIGITTAVLNPYSQCIGQGAANVSYGYRNDAQKFSGGSISSYGATYTVGDVIGVALDLDAGTLAFYKNGSAQGTAYSSISGTYFPGISDVDNNTSRNSTFIANFGQRPFAYTPPSGFLKLNTFNLPDSTIEKGDDYFNTVLWTGTGSGQSITGMNFQPDWLWFKQRNGTSGHALIDSVRGVNQGLVSNTTAAEVTSGANNDLVSFDSDGFTTGTPQYFGSLGSNGNTIVTWSWRAGSTTTNTAGSEDSVISANTTAGFSIVSYTGTGANMTIGHGLGAVPSAMIFKIRNSADNWAVWHNSFAVNQYVYLNNTTAKATVSTFMNGTLPTSTLISLGTWATVNYTASHNYIAYCFTEKEGYSSFGSYTGNGSADGPFVYTGFRPAMIMVKRFDTTNNWLVHDNKRDPYNQVVNGLIPNSANAEFVGNSANYGFDFVSNGFKAKGTTGGGNDSGGSYIYMAFAENPFKNSNAR